MEKINFFFIDKGLAREYLITDERGIPTNILAVVGIPILETIPGLHETIQSACLRYLTSMGGEIEQ